MSKKDKDYASSNKSILIDTFVRLISILSKFLFGIFLLKYLDEHNFGLFTYINAIIFFCIYLCSFDIYTFFHRDYVKKKLTLEELITYQIKVSTTITILVSILLFLYFSISNDLSLILKISICLLLLIETLYAEMFRVFRLIDKFSFANLVNLLKIITMSLSLLLFIGFEIENKLSIIIIFWIVSSLLCIYLMLSKLQYNFKKYMNYTLQFKYFYKALLSSLLMFLSTVVIRFLLSFDRLFFGYINNSEALVIFGFFFMIGSVLTIMIDAGVGSKLYANILNKNLNKKKLITISNILSIGKKYFVISFFYFLIMIFFLYFGIDILLIFVDKMFLQNYLTIGYFMLSIAYIHSIGIPFALVLFKKHADSLTLKINLFSLFPILLIFFIYYENYIFFCYVLLLCAIVNSFLKIFIFKFIVK